MYMTSGQLYIPNFYMAFRETEIVHRVSMYSSKLRVTVAHPV